MLHRDGNQHAHALWQICPPCPAATHSRSNHFSNETFGHTSRKLNCSYSWSAYPCCCLQCHWTVLGVPGGVMCSRFVSSIAQKRLQKLIKLRFQSQISSCKCINFNGRYHNFDKNCSEVRGYIGTGGGKSTPQTRAFGNNSRKDLAIGAMYNISLRDNIPRILLSSPHPSWEPEHDVESSPSYVAAGSRWRSLLLHKTILQPSCVNGHDTAFCRQTEVLERT